MPFERFLGGFHQNTDRILFWAHPWRNFRNPAGDHSKVEFVLSAMRSHKKVECSLLWNMEGKDWIVSGCFWRTFRIALQTSRHLFNNFFQRLLLDQKISWLTVLFLLKGRLGLCVTMPADFFLTLKSKRLLILKPHARSCVKFSELGNFHFFLFVLISVSCD